MPPSLVALLPSLRACGEGASLIHPRREREPLLLARGAGLPTVKERSGLRVCGKVAGSSRPRRRWSSLRACGNVLRWSVLPAGLSSARRCSLQNGCFLCGRAALVRRRRLARRGGAGYVSAPHREGRRISLFCSPERSRPLPVLILPGSFGLSSVPCSMPQRNWRALRVSACVLAAEADSRASKKAGKTGFPALFDERRPSAALRSEFSEFRPPRSGRNICRPGGTSDSRCAHGVRRVPRHPCRSCERVDYLMYWFSHLVMVPSALMPAIQSFTALSRSG